LTDLLNRSVEKANQAKAQTYDDATIAEARRQLAAQGYKPEHIDAALQSLTGKTPQPEGMNVDEAFRMNPPSDLPRHPGEGPMDQAKFQKTLEQVGDLSDKAAKFGAKANALGSIPTRPLEPIDTDIQLEELLKKYGKKH